MLKLKTCALLAILGLTGAAPAKAEILKVIASDLKQPDLLSQLPGEDQAVLNMTHPPFVVLGADWKWQCRICTTLAEITKSESQEPGESKETIIASQWQIRDNYFWSNGEAVTGADVERTFHLLRTTIPQINQIIKKIAVDPKDPRHFEIQFRQNRSNIYQLFAVRLIPAAMNLDVSYGPYAISLWQEQKVTLTPNTFYKTAPGEARFTSVEFYSGWSDTFTKDTGPMLILPSAFEAHEDLLAHIKGMNERFNLFAGISPTLEIVFFNMKNPFLVNAVLRRQLAYALDKNHINEQLFHGQGQTTASFFHPADQTCTAKNVDLTPPLPPNESRPTSFTKIEITYPATRRKQALFELIRKDWVKLGIQVEGHEVSNEFFQSKVIKEAHFSDVALMSWTTPSGTIPYHSFISAEIPSLENGFHGQNITGWTNREIDDLFERLVTANQEELRGICEKLLTEYVHDQPAIPLLFRPFYVANSRNLLGVTPVQHLYSSTLFSDSWRPAEILTSRP